MPIDSIEGKRIKLFYLDPIFLTRILSTGKYIRVKNNLPEGSILWRVSYDWTRDSMVCVVWHHSFPPIKEGEQIPIVDFDVEYFIEEIQRETK